MATVAQVGGGRCDFFEAVTPSAEVQCDLDARREQMLADNEHNVDFIARTLQKRFPWQVPFEDLHSAGMVGLFEAMRKFEPGKYANFNSYAQFRIRGAILDSLRQGDWGPRRLRRKGRQIQNAMLALREELCREPTEMEVATRLNVTVDRLRTVKCQVRGLEADWGSSTAIAQLPAAPDDAPLSLLLDAELRESLDAAVAKLSDHHRVVLIYYYYHEWKQREIAAELGVSLGRVSQILQAAISKLRILMKDV